MLLLWQLKPPVVIHRMQEHAVHRGIKNVDRELSWCRPNSDRHEPLTPFFRLQSRKQANNICTIVSPCGTNRATCINSSRMESPTNKDGLLLKRRMSPPLPSVLSTCNLTSIPCGWLGFVTCALLEQLSPCNSFKASHSVFSRGLGRDVDKRSLISSTSAVEED